jgi:hypothetical protein
VHANVPKDPFKKVAVPFEATPDLVQTSAVALLAAARIAIVDAVLADATDVHAIETGPNQRLVYYTAALQLWTMFKVPVHTGLYDSERLRPLQTVADAVVVFPILVLESFTGTEPLEIPLPGDTVPALVISVTLPIANGTPTVTKSTLAFKGYARRGTYHTWELQVGTGTEPLSISVGDERSLTVTFVSVPNPSSWHTRNDPIDTILDTIAIVPYEKGKPMAKRHAQSFTSWVNLDDNTDTHTDTASFISLHAMAQHAKMVSLQPSGMNHSVFSRGTTLQADAVVSPSDAIVLPQDPTTNVSGPIGTQSDRQLCMFTQLDPRVVAAVAAHARGDLPAFPPVCTLRLHSAHEQYTIAQSIPTGTRLLTDGNDTDWTPSEVVSWWARAAALRLVPTHVHMDNAMTGSTLRFVVIAAWRVATVALGVQTAHPLFVTLEIASHARTTSKRDVAAAALAIQSAVGGNNPLLAGLHTATMSWRNQFSMLQLLRHTTSVAQSKSSLVLSALKVILDTASRPLSATTLYHTHMHAAAVRGTNTTTIGATATAYPKAPWTSPFYVYDVRSAYEYLAPTLVQARSRDNPDALSNSHTSTHYHFMITDAVDATAWILRVAQELGGFSSPAEMHAANPIAKKLASFHADSTDKGREKYAWLPTGPTESMTAAHLTLTKRTHSPESLFADRLFTLSLG